MPKFILGSGCRDNPTLFICGERPGIEEYRRGLGFVGPAGEELWSRLWRTCRIRRRECWVDNLVKTFSKKPPTQEEIDRDWPLMYDAIRRIRPAVIVTVGYHAARRFLPQFAQVNGDQFHGLAYPYVYGRLSPRTATVVPVVHSSAALRQPSLYQNQLTDDLAAVHRVLTGRQGLHHSRPLEAHRVGLASILDGGDTRPLGLDTEGYAHDPQCLTLSNLGLESCLVETYEQRRETPALVHVQAVLDQAPTIYIHSAVSDWHLTNRLGLRLPPRTVRCTMLMASLLGLPKSLKTLSYRLFGHEMSSYEDLIQPLDDAAVRRTLQEVLHREQKASENLALQDRQRRHRKGQSRQTQGSRVTADQQARRLGASREAEASGAGHHARRRVAGTSRGDLRGGTGRSTSRQVRAADRGPRQDAAPTFPRRALTSIKGILTKPAQKTLRERWQDSKFAPFATLPPEPTWKDVPQLTRETYAMADAIGHVEVGRRLWPKIVARDLERVFRLDMGVLPWLVRSEHVGMACDARMLHGLSRQFAREYAEVCGRINRLAGHDVNPLSGEQVSDTLFDELGITPTKPTKSHKHYSTGDKYLKARRPEHEIVQLVITARQLNKYKSTYTDRLPGLLRHGRYHMDWRYATTATGRLAEEIIILIPKHDPTSRDQHGKQIRMDRAKAIRDCFHATEGHTLVAVDLSQIELRQMAHESQDRRMMRAFERGEDYHAQVAYDLLGAPRKREDQDDSAHRLPSKTINFGIINGMSAYGMLDQLHEAGQLHWTLDAVQDLLDEWFMVHHGVKRYWNAQIAFCQKHGYVRDMFGRRRYLSAIWSTDDRVRTEAERQTLMPIQAGADGISKVWNRRLWHRVIRPRQAKGQYCEPWVREHDCTTLEVDTRHAKAVMREMMDLVPDMLTVPTTSEGKMGDRWGSLEKAA